MADVIFNIVLEQNCANEHITFADKTVDGSNGDGSNNYGNTNDNQRADVKAIQFELTKHDGTAYTAFIAPHAPIILEEINLTPQMFLSTWTKFEDMNYGFKYKVFFNQITTGNIVNGKTHMVYDGGISDYITYGGTQYKNGETFLGTATNTFATQGSAKVTLQQDTYYECNMLYWCNTRRCIRNLMMKYRLNKCEKNSELLKKLSIYDTELNSIIVTYREGNITEGSEGIQELSEFCKTVFNECGC